jgi:hypothetical protein
LSAQALIIIIITYLDFAEGLGHSGSGALVAVAAVALALLESECLHSVLAIQQVAGWKVTHGVFWFCLLVYLLNQGCRDCLAARTNWATDLLESGF